MVSRALSIFVQVDILRCSFDCDLMNMLCVWWRMKEWVRQFSSFFFSTQEYYHTDDDDDDYMMILNDSCHSIPLCDFSTSSHTLFNAISNEPFFCVNCEHLCAMTMGSNSMRKIPTEFVELFVLCASFRLKFKFT